MANSLKIIDKVTFFKMLGMPAEEENVKLHP